MEVNIRVEFGPSSKPWNKVFINTHLFLTLITRIFGNVHGKKNTLRILQKKKCYGDHNWENFFLIFAFSPLFIVLFLYWGYTTTFTKVLTIYHS
jgi:hypothetical protein